MDASGKVVVNEVFSGVAYPDKLESFLHGMVSRHSCICISRQSMLSASDSSNFILRVVLPGAEGGKYAILLEDSIVLWLALSDADAAMQDGPDGSSLAKDVQGTWSLQHDAFQGQTIIRSLIWPGYHFYFNSNTTSWGSQYNGNGCKNNDLVFML